MPGTKVGNERKDDDRLPRRAISDAADQLQRATEYHKQGRLAEAEALYVDQLAAEPENFDALNRLGILKYQCGHLDEAGRLLTAAIAQNPDSDKALSDLASLLLAQKRL